MGLVGSVLSIGRKVLKCTPEFVFGDSAKVIGDGYKATQGSIFQKAKGALKAFDTHVDNLHSSEGGFLKRTLKRTFWDLPKDIWNVSKTCIKAANVKPLMKCLNVVKGIGKTVLKKVPYIGAVLTLLFEAPAIYEGWKKGGIGGALEQCGGAGIELGCMAVGTAIGACFGAPTVGSIVGGLVGWVARMFIVPEAEEESTEEKPEGSDKPEENNTNNTNNTNNADSPVKEDNTDTSSAEPEKTAKITVQDLTGVSPISSLNIGNTNLFNPNNSSTAGNTNSEFGNLLLGGMDFNMSNSMMTNPIMGGMNFGFPNYMMFNPYIGDMNLAMGDPSMMFNPCMSGMGSDVMSPLMGMGPNPFAINPFFNSQLKKA